MEQGVGRKLCHAKGDRALILSAYTISFVLQLEEIVMATNAEKHYQEWPHNIAEMKEASPDITRGFGGMFQKLMGPGALTVREKELIALAIGMATRCEACIYAHTEKAVKAGATRAELLEMAGVVVTMQGGPGYVYVPKLIDAMNALGLEAETPASA
jgi:AhpD family alkylhydroperoxidase